MSKLALDPIKSVPQIGDFVSPIKPANKLPLGLKKGRVYTVLAACTPIDPQNRQWDGYWLCIEGISKPDEVETFIASAYFGFVRNK